MVAALDLNARDMGRAARTAVLDKHSSQRRAREFEADLHRTMDREQENRAANTRRALA